jgi:hypothetical protein
MSCNEPAIVPKACILTETLRAVPLNTASEEEAGMEANRGYG